MGALITIADKASEPANSPLSLRTFRLRQADPRPVVNLFRGEDDPNHCPI
jgi:hypothetical protein